MKAKLAMRGRWVVLLFFAATLLNGATGLYAAEVKEPSVTPPDRGKTKQAEASAGMPLYVPPLRGAPGGRFGGGTRGLDTKPITVQVLVPDHVGWTSQTQPVLYWFISGETALPVEFTITQTGQPKPLAVKRFAGPVKPGVHPVPLSELGLSLGVNARYEWFVVVKNEAGKKNKAAFSGAIMECVEPPAGLREKLAKAGKPRAAHVYAEAGLWYDALAAVSEEIASRPNDAELRKKRAALLDQVGLKEVAEFELKAAESAR
jgi:hypothetical protein